MKPPQLPGWLQRRLRQSGLEIDPDALQFLCDKVEGNLLAAVQEVEKLRLLTGGERIGIEHVRQTVADNARYDLFAMVDHALSGDPGSAFRVFHGLRAEGTEAIMLLWALSREIRSLYQCQSDIARGEPRNRVLQAQRIWDSRKRAVGAALDRHSLDDLAELLGQSARVDYSIKGLADGEPWERLGRLLLQLATSVEQPRRAAGAL